ncbi:hypothetical protein [Cupriavidus sp. TMH.W2]|uniref:hypothetical protein n=1 Tax=Cupriavidus sp. TMH.W2 TaxID=3434465 RepID=UPI003D76CB5D
MGNDAKMQKWAGATEREQRIAELRHEELSLHAVIASIDRKLVGGSTAVSLALRDARKRELAAVEARLIAYSETPKSPAETGGE